MASPAGSLRRFFVRLAGGWRPAGLVTRLMLVATVITAVVVSAVFLVLGAETRRTARDLFAAELANNAGTIAKLHGTRLNELLVTASITTRNPSLRAAMELTNQDSASSVGSQEIETIEREVLRTANELDKDLVVLTDREGRVLAANRTRGLATGFDLSWLPAVKTVLEPMLESGSGSFSILDIDGLYYQVGVVPIEMGGFPIGSLLVGDRVADTFLDGLGRTFSGGIVIAAGGRIIASRRADVVGNELAALSQDQSAGAASSTTVHAGNEEFAVASLPMGIDRHGKRVSLYLTVSVTKSLARVNAAFRRSFLLYGLLAVVLVGVGAGATAHTLIGPLSRFVSFMRQVAASQDYSLRFDAAPEAPEIRTLKASYDQLIGSLETQHRELLRHADELAGANTALTEQISERERAERALAASEEQLRQAQKLEAIGTLAGGVAHDFNNLLTVILGHSEWLLEDVGDGSPLRKDIKQIQAAGRRAAGLTQQLLAFSRKQVSQPKVLDLNGLVGGFESMLRRLIGEDVELSTVLRSRSAWVKADENQLEQVIMNLAVNARDAMPQGGSLRIEIAAGPGIGDELSTPSGGRGWVQLAVTDTGTGMDADTKRRIFEPFFTTKELGKGTGLGLSTVYGIVRQSEGQIEVDSEVGVGTTFRVLFPAVAPPESLGAETRIAEPVPTGKETILVVEDEEPVRELTVRILERHGYHVLSATGGVKALEIAQAHPGSIPLLLTDVVMPGLTGKELYRRLLEMRPSVRVLYMSGYPDETIATHGLLEPGLALIQKPFAVGDLVRRVREMLDRELETSGAAA